MITVADIRSFDTRVDTNAAGQIAGLWNIAYPHMRSALTGVIDGNRRYLAEADKWRLSEDTRTGIVRRIKEAERVRRDLGQLDRTAAGAELDALIAAATPVEVKP